MYNVRIIEYPSGFQCRVYRSPVLDGAAPHGRDEDCISLLEDYGYLFQEDEEEVPEEIMKSRKERSMYVSVSRTVNKVYYLARSNAWDWFVTLTFDPDRVDSFSYRACTDALKNWIDASRRLCPDMKYLLVPEMHKSGRFHFHGLFADCEGLGFVDSGKKQDGQTVYNVGRYRLGFSTATRVRDNERVTKYITKYISKDLCAASPHKKRYWASRNLSRAPVKDYEMEGSAYGKFYQSVLPFVRHVSETESPYNEVKYFELAKGFENLLGGDCGL